MTPRPTQDQWEEYLIRQAQWHDKLITRLTKLETNQKWHFRIIWGVLALVGTTVSAVVHSLLTK